MKKTILWVLGALLLGVSGCKKEDGGDPTPPNNTRKVTYIILEVLDSNIVADGVVALNELQQMCKGGYDRALAVANFDKATRQKMKLDGTLYSICTDGEWKTLKVSSGIDKLGADSRYLTEAINMAMEKIPADDYVLVLNSHGGGWDTTDAEDVITRSCLSGGEEGTLFGKGLSLNRLRQGVKNSNLGKAGKKLKLIYFDNCLMHTAEYLTELGDVAEYSLGSPTLSYTAEQKNKVLISNIRQCTSFEEALTRSCTSIVSSWGQSECYAVFQAVDLSKMSAVLPAVGALVDNMLAAFAADQSGALLAAAQEVRSSTFCYNGKDYQFPLYDMGDFLFRMKAVMNSAAYNTLYDQFIAASKAALLYSKPTMSSNSGAAYTGTLAPGNTNYLFSVLVSRYQLLGEKSPYLQDGYASLLLASQGKWDKLLKALNTSDSRDPYGW